MKLFSTVLVLAFFFLGQTSVFWAAESDGEVRGRILDSRGVVLAKTTPGGLRRYPKAGETGHFTGYVRGKDGRGAFGLEKASDESLSAGRDLNLTIDLRIQDIARAAFPEGKKGAVVVMEPNSGAVLAMASFPEFDPNEKSGGSPAKLFQKRGLSVTPGDRAMMTIGQGTVLATPMQAASVSATIANAGKRFQVHLVSRDKATPLADLTASGITPAHIEVVRKAMWRVVNDPGGSASKLRSTDIALAGKTGTAMTGRPDRPYHAWFFGFGPYENPELAICVFVENGESGSWVAGPIAGEILLKGLSLLDK